MLTSIRGVTLIRAWVLIPGNTVTVDLLLQHWTEMLLYSEHGSKTEVHINFLPHPLLSYFWYNCTVQVMHICLRKRYQKV